MHAHSMSQSYFSIRSNARCANHQFISLDLEGLIPGGLKVVVVVVVVVVHTFEIQSPHK